MFFLQDARGDSLETVYQAGNRCLRYIMHQKMNVVLLAVDLDQIRLKIRADPREYLPHVIQVFFPKYCLTVLRDEDQMYMQIEDAVPVVPHCI